MSKKIEAMLEEIKNQKIETSHHEKYVTIEVVAEYLSLSKWAIYKRASNGQIPHKKFGGKLRFKLSEIDST